MIDLRSDTVTKPTPEMRRAMMEAEVGDDVYGEDPTVNRLERRAAEIAGKEAALFVPSGTMGNTIAVKLHTEPGQEVICDARAHVLDYELAMVAWFSGCVVRAIPTGDGILSWDAVRARIRPLGPHWAPTGLIEIENTHNMAGGTVYPLATIREICDGAHERGLKVHMDGARVFNAAAAMGLPVPQGFVLATDWCRAAQGGAGVDEQLQAVLRSRISNLEQTTGLGFGSARRPLLVSVRSGAPVSMPGMMETVLNVGLTDATLDGFLKLSGDHRLVWDSYRRLIQSFAEVVAGVSAAPFESALDVALRRGPVPHHANRPRRGTLHRGCRHARAGGGRGTGGLPVRRCLG